MTPIESWIHALRHEAVTPLMKALSFTGEPVFFLLVFTVGFWCFHRRIFARATLLVTFVGLVNHVMKDLWAMPRPEEVLHLVEASGWSFPSGHSMVAGALWPWLAWEHRRSTGAGWSRWVGWAVAVGVATSRVYLGVHRIQDVVAGLVFGALIAAVASRWVTVGPPRVWRALGSTGQALAVIALCLVAVFAFPPHNHDTTGAKAGASLAVLWIGFRWERGRGFGLPAGRGRILATALLGLFGTFAVRALSKELLGPLEHEALRDFLRYGLVSAWATFGALTAFRLLGLLDRDDRPRT